MDRVQFDCFYFIVIPLALNFANGSETGGGFLRGATAQEEALCRSSALYATLINDPMYDFHRKRELWTESSDWTILSPNVPVFRDDRGMELDEPWLLSFITCAAPYSCASCRSCFGRHLVNYAKERGWATSHAESGLSYPISD